MIFELIVRPEDRIFEQLFATHEVIDKFLLRFKTENLSSWLLTYIWALTVIDVNDETSVRKKSHLVKLSPILHPQAMWMEMQRVT